MRVKEGQDLEREISQNQPALKMLGEIPLNKALAQKHKELTIGGTPVLFPYEPYKVQVDYMTEVIRSLDKRQNGLLQSPTGTGKTLSLLCSSLAWLRKHRSEHPNEEHPVRIIYLSRTHQQLKQVVRELKKTAYQPRIVVAASRDHACCNKELKGLSGALKELECRKRIGGVDNKSCAYSRIEQTYSAMAPKVSQRVMDLEDLVQYGQQNMMCPFYYSRRVKEMMDMVFMPYNYLLDRRVSKLFNISCRNAILIFDEAHNVASTSEECNSIEMSTAVLTAAIEQLSTLKEIMLRSAKGLKPEKKIQLQMANNYDSVVKNDPEHNQFKSNVSSIESFLRPIVHLKGFLTTAVHELFKSNEQMEEGILIGFKRFYEMLLKGMEPSHPMQDFADYHQKSQMILADMLYVSNWAVDSWIHFFMEMHSVTNGSDNLASKYTISLKMNGSDLQINAICLDPARSFNFLREHEPYSIILTSGTLTPIKFWEAELQVKFPKPLCCPHIIQSEQLFAATVTHGPKNHPLNFSFKERDKTVVYKALGEVLLEIVRSVPSGIIVLFSSYGLMDTCCHELRNYSLMGQFYKHKEMFIEDRNSVNFKDQLENFTKASRTGKGALMFAVMRGKVAEGIDLCDDECRAIVLVGVPFPNLKDKRIEAKKNYLDAQKSALNGRDWYMAETYRSINQALGRVIRGINDYGAVYLLDQRFEKQEIRQHISDWVSSRLETYYDIGRLGLETRKFFQERSKKEVKKPQPARTDTEQPFPVPSSGKVEQDQPKEVFPFKSISLGRKSNISGPKRKPLPTATQPVERPTKSECVPSANGKPRNQLLSFLNQIKQEEANKKLTTTPAGTSNPLVRPPPGHLIKTPAKPMMIEQQRPPSEADRSNYKVDHFDSEAVAEQSQCPICKINKKLIKNRACSHSLCLICWETWLQTRLSCPICRQRRWATGLRAVLRQHRVSFFFSGQATKERLTRFERYAVIRERNNRIKQANREKRELERTEKMNSIPKDSKQLTCEGCSVYLQSSRMDKYGYIDGKVLADSIIHNQQLLNEPTDRTDDTIRIIREVQQQLGVEVLDEKNGPLKNLDNLEVLMRIEQKQQESRKERQAIVPPRQQRKELLCRRCFYLKHHNQLPDEHNHIQPIIDETDEKQLLERIFAKKGDTYYFYLIDIFDVCGTLTETVLERLFLSKMQFTLLLSKFDMVNRKYFNYVAMKPQIRQYIVATLDKLKEQGTVPKDYRLEDYMQYIYFISSDNKVGLNKVKKLLEGMACKVQMIGYPNTGKTSLLNAITSQKKPTSTVPGTSLTFQIGKFNRIKIFDCPGLYNRSSMVNLINKPNAKSLLTWKQPHFAPGILTNSVVFYGGMIQAEGVRVILFGNGGAKAVEKGNSARWLLKNYEEFWKGLPSLEYLNIVKHELRVEFEDGKGPDIEIAGYGFIGLRLCRTGKYGEEHVSKTIALYLPATVEFRVRNTLVLDQGFHDKSAIQKSFRLRRLVEQTK